VDYRLAAGYKAVELGHQLLTSADNKALIALAFQGAILAGMASTSELTRQAMQRCLASCHGYRVVYLLAAMFFCQAVSILKALSVIYPNLPERPRDGRSHLFYFATVAAMTEGEYLAALRNLTPVGIEAELATHSHKLSTMVKAKFTRVQSSLFWLRFQVVFAALAALMLFITPM
jgi:hypothetical protein